MSFLWPIGLLALLALPLGVVLARRMGRRRRLAIAAYGSLASAAAAPGPGSRLRRGLPLAFVLLGLAVLLIGVARPEAVVSLPKAQGTVLLAFDVSGSMAATDLKPTRMEAAKAAARDFVKRQPLSVAIGVVAFSDSGFSVQAPTNEQETVLAAINRLAPTRGTSLGEGIFASLTAIETAERGEATNYYSNRSAAPTPSSTPVPAGSHDSAVIVLFTDGENTVAPDPVAAAQAAADRGVRIDTVGIGSAAGVTLDVEGFRVHTQLNEPLLEQTADLTKGDYYPAARESDLAAIYDRIESRLVAKPELTEVTSLFAGAGILFLLIGGVSSLAWLGRLP